MKTSIAWILVTLILINSIFASSEMEIEKLEPSYISQAEEEEREGHKALLLGEGTSEQDEEKRRLYYVEAKNRYQAAATIYEQLLQWAREISDSEREEKYSTLIGNCNASISNAERLINSEDHRKNAESWYTEAQELYSRGLCKNAGNYTDRSKKMFDSIKDPAGAYKCETLQEQIKECLMEYETAQQMMEMAIKSYSIADYKNATGILEQAERIYAKYENQQVLNNITGIKQQISEGTESKRHADQLMDEATTLFKKNDFPNSKTKAEQAREIYKRINYETGINQSTKLIDKAIKIEGTTIGPGEITLLHILIASILIAVIVLLAIIKLKKK